jgi:hypothetical protein
MTDWELSLLQFSQLMATVSRHHAKQIAEDLSLTAHRKDRMLYFRDNAGGVVPIKQVFEMSQSEPEAKRHCYNLWMSYFR